MALSTTVSAITREKFIPVLVDNVYNSNVLCLKLLKNAEKLDGGKNIVTPVETAKIGDTVTTHGWISDGGNTATDKEETVQKATWDWATSYVGLKIPGSEELVNKGSSQVISLLKSKLKQSEKKIRDMFGDGMFADAQVTNGLTTLNGVGDFDDDVDHTSLDNGVEAIIETVPDATTFHCKGGVAGSIVGWNRALAGIDTASSSNVFWNGNMGTFNLASGLETGATSTISASWTDLISLVGGVSNLSKAMTRMYGACTIDNDQPDLIITTQAIYDAYETSLQANKRFAGSDDIANAGFDSLRFKGATVVVDSHCPAGQMYFLNTDYLDIKVHKDRNFAFEDFRRLEGSDNLQSRLFWMGQLVCTNPRMNGVLAGGPTDYA